MSTTKKGLRDTHGRNVEITRGETLGVMTMAAVLLGCIILFANWITDCGANPDSTTSTVPISHGQNPVAMEEGDSSLPCNHHSATTGGQHQHSIISRGPVTEVVECWNENSKLAYKKIRLILEIIQI